MEQNNSIRSIRENQNELELRKSPSSSSLSLIRNPRNRNLFHPEPGSSKVFTHRNSMYRYK